MPIIYKILYAHVNIPQILLFNYYSEIHKNPLYKIFWLKFVKILMPDIFQIIDESQITTMI